MSIGWRSAVHQFSRRAILRMSAVVALLCGVGAASPWVLLAQSPRVREIDGVRTVENASRRTAPVAFRLAANPTIDFGGLKNNIEDEFTANGGYLRSIRLSDGGYAVIDETRIRFYDMAGRQFKVTGRKGGGPGEFGQITGICRARGDTLVVHDPSNGRVTIVDRKGAVVREFPVGHMELPWFGGCFDDGTFVVVQSMPAFDGKSGSMKLIRHRLDGRIVGTLGPFWSSSHNAFITTIATVVASGTRLYLGDPRTSEVKVFNPQGTLIAIIRTDDPIERIAAADRSTMKPQSWVRMGSDAASAAVAAERTRMASKPTDWPSYGTIAVDPAGRLWVQDYHKTRFDPYVYTGFDRDGHMLGKFTVPAPTKAEDPMVVAFTENGVMVRRKDNDGAVHLTTYALVSVRKSQN